MSDTRTQLKARFAAGQRIGESDFSALIDSLAHLTEDIASGSLATGDQLSALSSGLEDLKIYAEAIRSEFDNYIGTHATDQYVIESDAAVRDELNATITQSVQSLQSTDLELIEITSGNTDLSLELLSLYLDSFESVDSDIANLQAQSATNELLNLKVSELQSEIESKADIVHTHEEYATKVSIGNFITAEDIPNFAAEIHQHTAADITDLDGMFATDARVLELINENRSTIDVNAIIADGYYSKGEVDQKFYVFTLDTSQVIGFNDEVSNIATSIAQVELATAKEEISSDVNQLSLDLTDLTSTVGSNSTAITTNDTQVRVDFAASDLTTLTSANSYTDGKITDLIGGAGDAYDTLKEIQTALEAGDATGDVLTSLNSINQEIDSNDTELDNIRKWLGRTADELASDPNVTSLSNDVDAGETIINVLDQTGFSIGDEIVIGEGTSSEEATIADLGSLVLESPLTKSHAAGTKISLKNPLISSISSISGGSASSSDLEALQQTVSTLESSITTLQTDLSTAQTSITSLQEEVIAQQVLISELEQMVDEGNYSQNNYFAFNYVTDGYGATF